MWLELRVDAAAEAVDWVCARLATTPYSHKIHITPYVGAAIDNEFVAPPINWTSTLFLHLPCDGSEATQLAVIEAALASLEHGGLTSSLQHRVVASPTVEAGSMTQRIGQRFVVTSADGPDRAPSAADILLRLKPSPAFGSGLHPATQLSLQLLEQYVVKGMNVLDLGSGSGILSVAMAKLGAQVLALDNDPVAVLATQDAVQRNEVATRVRVMAGSLGRGNHLGHWMGGAMDQTMPALAIATQFDLIAANVQAQFHVALAADYRDALQPVSDTGGWLVTGGFTTDYSPGVTAALEAVGFELIAEAHDHDWLALAHRLKS